MVGNIEIFREKSFEFFFSTNSTELSAENHFPWKKMYEKLAPAQRAILNFTPSFTPRAEHSV
jgi:hypothetical protein